MVSNSIILKNQWGGYCVCVLYCLSVGIWLKYLNYKSKVVYA